jgi:hypothetical protein
LEITSVEPQSHLVTDTIDRRKTAAVCLLLFFGTLALYWPVRHFDFVQYDDNEYVFDNPTVRAGLSWWGVAWSFVDAHALNWHPLTWLSHMLDCQLFGLNPGPHHMVNALLHSANAALLFLALQSMTGAFWRTAFVAALFAWHPLRVESVAWISERKDVLSGFFFLLTLWAYTRFTKQQDAATRRKTGFSTIWRSSSYRWSLFFFVLGLLSKPMLVTVPVVLLLVDLWPLNRLKAPATGNERWCGMPKALLLEKLPFLFLALGLSVITFFAQRSGGAFEPVPIPLRIENAAVGYVTYLEKLFWPKDLACLYLRPSSIPQVRLLLSVLVLSAITLLSALVFRRRPYLGVGWLWFCVMLLPVSGLVPVGLQSVADRYTYLPAIGLLLAILWGTYDLVASKVSLKVSSSLFMVVTIPILLACVLATHRQLFYWRDTETLMTRVLQLDPNNYIAHANLGVFFSKQGNTKEALFHYQRARELAPANQRSPFKSGSNSGSRDQSAPSRSPSQ